MTHTHEHQDSEMHDDAIVDEEKSTVEPTAPEPENHRSVDPDTEAPPEKVQTSAKRHTKNPLSYYWSHKKWAIPATILALIVIVLAVPYTRYKTLDLFLREDITISVIDSSTNSPVSGAQLQFGSTTAITAANGKAQIRIPVGHASVAISKQYYKSTNALIFVSYAKNQDSFTVHVVATGRQVPIVVLNKITNNPIPNAELKVLDTETKTDKNGKATIVLPVGASSQSGQVIANGYNTLATSVQVTGQAVVANTFLLTPSGYVYFLSNLSGKVDIVKTNLDGTNRQTVLAGTGHEIPGSTILLASRDWKYLALLTQRNATGNPELDLIDTSTDTMSNIDEGNATFTLVGWDGDRFIYRVGRTAIQDWQNNQQALKSFNAPTKTLTVLAQTTASGSSQYDWIGQQISDTYILNDQVVYAISWLSSYDNVYQMNSKQATLNSVNPDGSGNTTLKSFSVAAGTQTSDISLTIEPYDNPSSLAIQFFNGGQPADSYYEYENGQVTSTTELNDQNFYNNTYATYLESPSGNQTFWSSPADGKNTLTVGDKNGNNGNKIAILSDYDTYGWYTDNYLLVSKNGSELYIMPVTGGTPLRITDYFKPGQFFNGYGGGYGGR